MLTRRGCSLQNCQYLSTNYEGDYENVTNPDNTPSQQIAISHQRRYDRSFSPPRSSNSSGYGTGSSSRSFNDPRFAVEGTMTSTGSGHSTADDRWWVSCPKALLRLRSFFRPLYDDCDQRVWEKPLYRWTTSCAWPIAVVVALVVFSLSLTLNTFFFGKQKNSC